MGRSDRQPASSLASTTEILIRITLVFPRGVSVMVRPRILLLVLFLILFTVGIGTAVVSFLSSSSTAEHDVAILLPPPAMPTFTAPVVTAPVTAPTMITDLPLLIESVPAVSPPGGMGEIFAAPAPITVIIPTVILPTVAATGTPIFQLNQSSTPAQVNPTPVPPITMVPVGSTSLSDLDSRTPARGNCAIEFR